MYLSDRLYRPLAHLDDGTWQEILANHPFWRDAGIKLDDEHQDIAFHILMSEGQLASQKVDSPSEFEFDSVAIRPDIFENEKFRGAICEWASMHARSYGPGITVKMGLYVIRSGGLLGYHIDGPVFLRGARVDLSDSAVQRGLIEVQASHRTILPLRFNDEDEFLICGHRAPMKKNELFEFSNVLPHAYKNVGPEHAVLLVTTYLQENLIPEEIVYAKAES